MRKALYLKVDTTARAQTFLHDFTDGVKSDLSLLAKDWSSLVFLLTLCGRCSLHPRADEVSQRPLWAGWLCHRSCHLWDHFQGDSRGGIDLGITFTREGFKLLAQGRTRQKAGSFLSFATNKMAMTVVWTFGGTYKQHEKACFLVFVKKD